jgi:hypothetical protein
LPKLNFSKDVLEVLSLEDRQALVVLPVPGVTWSDWGTSHRVTSDLVRLDKPGAFRKESHSIVNP